MGPAMKLSSKEYREETNGKKRIFYHYPLARKRQRTTAPPQPPGVVRHFTEEEIFLVNLKRLNWKGEFQT